MSEPFDYEKPNWVNVPRGQTPPEGAPALNAAALDAIGDAIDSLEERTTELEAGGGGSGVVNVRDHGATGDGTTDDTTAIQAAITAAADGGTVFLPVGAYKLSAALTIDKSITVEGAGVRAAYDSLNVTFRFDEPPTITGSVLVQTAAATDGVQITKAGAHVDLRDFGVRFDGAHRFTDTGHGVKVLPSTTYGSGHDHGLVNATWDNVMVFGHDGDHYAVQLTNPLLDTIRGLRSWGGGILDVVCDSHAGNYGNLVVEHPYGVLMCGGTAHGYSLRPRTGSGASGVLNLMTFIRPQCNTLDTPPDGADAVTAAQYLFRADDPQAVTGLAVINPDLECSDELANPVSFGGGNVFVDPSGIVGAPSDLDSRMFTVFRSQYGARRLNSDMVFFNTNSPGPTGTVVTASPGATISVTGDDMGGSISFYSGSAPAQYETLFHVTFGHIPSFSGVLMMPTNPYSGLAGAYITSKDTNLFRIACGVVTTQWAEQTLTWDFTVIR